MDFGIEISTKIETISFHPRLPQVMLSVFGEFWYYYFVPPNAPEVTFSNFGEARY